MKVAALQLKEKDGYYSESIIENIESWFSKVKPGGIISGHNFFDTIIDKIHFVVKLAVNEFASTNKLKTLVIHKDQFPSCFIL